MSTAVVIVGSSRGFGRSLLQSVIQNDQIMTSVPKVLVVLVTTSAEKAKAVFGDVYLSTFGREYNTQVDSHIEVIVEEVDLRDIADCIRVCSVVTVSLEHHRIPVRNVFAFLNSGSVEPVGPLLQTSHEREASLERFMKSAEIHVNLNFLSFIAITKAIAQYCIRHNVNRARIVNISSLAAIQELYGMSIYSAIKGARDSFFRSLALEIDQNHPKANMKFLSYAPGPMLTDLVKQSLIGPASRDNHVKKSETSFVDPKVSADCCLSLVLNDDRWTSGSHLDFYDVTTS